eukprot:Em0018g464a
MVDQAEGSQTDAQRGVQSTSANPAGFSGDDLMTLIRQSVQSILRESQLPTPNPPAPVVNATPPAILGRMPEPATVAGLHIPLVVPNAGASVLATDTMYLPPVSQISGASSAEVTASGLKKEQSLPFLLSEGLPTIPYKIVKKITNGEFVDMAELLRDNIEAERRASVVEGQKPPKAAHTARREIPDLLSWVQCFGTFIAIMASVYPGKVRQLLAYQTFIIREGRRLGGNGWRSYDTMFRQQAALDPAVDWSKINSTLYAVSFVAQPGTRVRSCSLCMESDHREEDCSLQLATRTPKKGEVSAAAQGRQRFTCFAWNDGRCFHPACRYRHACSRCQGGHRLPECRQPAPLASERRSGDGSQASKGGREQRC